MTKRQVRLGHCHRCVYTWQMRRRYPRMCPRCKSRLWNVPEVRPVQLGKGLGIEEILFPHRAAILRLARKYGAKGLRVFGSVRRREATERSDVDLLVEWRKPVSLLTHAVLESGIERIVGRKVDLVNEADLRWSAKPSVASEAVPL